MSYMKNNPFKSLKIIELASVLAGPSVGMFFAELGSDVLKIENKNTEGDVTRTWRTAHEDAGETSAYFTSVNWGKRFLKLDLNKEEDYQQLLTFVKSADIIISSYKAGDDKKLKVDYSTLKKINNQIIYAQITAYGLEDKRTGYDAILQAETGFMSMNGNPDSLPTKMPVALIDILAAHQLKEGILVALINRMTNKIGDHIHVSLKEAAIASLANQASNYLMTGVKPKRLGSEHPNIVPYGSLFETKDSKLLILAIGSDKQFLILCETLGKNDLAFNSKFETNQKRVIHRDELISLLRNHIFQFNSEYLLSELQSKMIPCALVKNLSEIFEDEDLQSLILSNELGSKKAVKTTIFKANNFKLNDYLTEPE